MPRSQESLRRRCTSIWLRGWVMSKHTSLLPQPWFSLLFFYSRYTDQVNKRILAPLSKGISENILHGFDHPGWKEWREKDRKATGMRGGRKGPGCKDEGLHEPSNGVKRPVIEQREKRVILRRPSSLPAPRIIAHHFPKSPPSPYIQCQSPKPLDWSPEEEGTSSCAWMEPWAVPFCGQGWWGHLADQTGLDLALWAVCSLLYQVTRFWPGGCDEFWPWCCLDKTSWLLILLRTKRPLVNMTLCFVGPCPPSLPVTIPTFYVPKLGSQAPHTHTVLHFNPSCLPHGTLLLLKHTGTFSYSGSSVIYHYIQASV